MATFLIGAVHSISQGLHRTLHQVLARAPNCSAAYCSTESRLQTFSEMFASPALLAQIARQNDDLTTGKGLALAIAKLVGGSRCMPAPGPQPSHKQLTRLLYHNHMKFTRGQEAKAVLKNSVPEILRANKTLGENSGSTIDS